MVARRPRGMLHRDGRERRALPARSSFFVYLFVCKKLERILSVHYESRWRFDFQPCYAARRRSGAKTASQRPHLTPPTDSRWRPAYHRWELPAREPSGSERVAWWRRPQRTFCRALRCRAGGASARAGASKRRQPRKTPEMEGRAGLEGGSSCPPVRFHGVFPVRHASLTGPLCATDNRAHASPARGGPTHR